MLDRDLSVLPVVSEERLVGVVAMRDLLRAPIRSTARKVVYALGLNVVVLTLRITPTWGGEPLGLPVNVRLYRKGGPSHLELGVVMVRELATWLPDRDFALTCDGAYAALAGVDLPRT